MRKGLYGLATNQEMSVNCFLPQHLLPVFTFLPPTPDTSGHWAGQNILMWLAVKHFGLLGFFCVKPNQTTGKSYKFTNLSADFDQSKKICRCENALSEEGLQYWRVLCSETSDYFTGRSDLPTLKAIVQMMLATSVCSRVKVQPSE